MIETKRSDWRMLLRSCQLRTKQQLEKGKTPYLFTPWRISSSVQQRSRSDFFMNMTVLNRTFQPKIKNDLMKFSHSTSTFNWNHFSTSLSNSTQIFGGRVFWNLQRGLSSKKEMSETKKSGNPNNEYYFAMLRKKFDEYSNTITYFLTHYLFLKRKFWREGIRTRKKGETRHCHRSGLSCLQRCFRQAAVHPSNKCKYWPKR